MKCFSKPCMSVRQTRVMARSLVAYLRLNTRYQIITTVDFKVVVLSPDNLTDFRRRDFNIYLND